MDRILLSDSTIRETEQTSTKLKILPRHHKKEDGEKKMRRVMKRKKATRKKVQPTWTTSRRFIKRKRGLRNWNRDWP